MQQGNTAPDWSGVFWEQEDGTGYMSIAWGDDREHTYPPKAWELTDMQESDEAFTLVYRRKAS